jgi:hypothetical protein
MQQLLAAAAGDGREVRLEWHRRRGELRSLLAPSRHGAREDIRDGDAEKRRRDVRAIVDVLREQTAVASRPPPPTHESNWIDVEHQRRGAPLRGGFRIHDVSLAEGELEALRAAGILVEQIAEIRRRLMSSADGQEHEVAFSCMSLIAASGRPEAQDGAKRS